jgi:hypothetical protein
VNAPKYALIQLVSEETMPNVIAALALEPASITMLHTASTATEASWIKRAIRHAGLTQPIRSLPLSRAPDIMETAAKVCRTCKHALAIGLQPVVNINGGTKLMSIGAFAATIGPALSAIYVDTECRRFLQPGKVPIPESLRDGDAAFTRAELRLNVDVVAATHGHNQISAGEDPTPYIELAEYLRAHPAEEHYCHHVFAALSSNGPMVEQLAMLDRRLPELPAGLTRLALAAGLLETRGGCHYIACRTRETIESAIRSPLNSTEFFAATRSLQFPQTFLNGGWWEVCVWHAAKQSGTFRDLRWSVRFGSDINHTEEDVVGVKGPNLALFSCKRGGPGARLHRGFEEFVSAARRLGGPSTTKYFCVAAPTREAHMTQVREEAVRVRAKIVTPALRLTPDAFTAWAPIPAPMPAKTAYARQADQGKEGVQSGDLAEPQKGEEDPATSSTA